MKRLLVMLVVTAIALMTAQSAFGMPGFSQAPGAPSAPAPGGTPAPAPGTTPAPAAPPAPATAQQPAAAPAPTSGEPIPTIIDIQLWPEYNDNQILFIEAFDFAQDVPLPIEVRAAIPKNATVSWVGELVGQTTEEDIQATPVINPKDDYTEVVFTLTKSRQGQIEASWPGLNIKDKRRTITFDWVQRYPAKTTRFSLKAPSQATNILTTPALKAIGTSPDRLENYSGDSVPMKVGDKQTLTISYDRSATGPSNAGQPVETQAPGAASSSSDTAIIVVFAVIAGIVLFGVYNYKKRATTEE